MKISTPASLIKEQHLVWILFVSLAYPKCYLNSTLSVGGWPFPRSKCLQLSLSPCHLKTAFLLNEPQLKPPPPGHVSNYNSSNNRSISRDYNRNSSMLTFRFVKKGGGGLFKYPYFIFRCKWNIWWLNCESQCYLSIFNKCQFKMSKSQKQKKIGLILASRVSYFMSFWL